MGKDWWQRVEIDWIKTNWSIWNRVDDEVESSFFRVCLYVIQIIIVRLID